MDTPASSTPRRPSRARRVLIGCLVLIAVAVVLAIAGCVGFVIWISDEGEVSEESVLMSGGEEIFASLYLTPDDEALIELTSDIIERNQQLQDSAGGIGRFFPKPDPEQASRQELEEALPLRVEGALYPAGVEGGYEHLVKAEISHQYRMYGLMFKAAALLIRFTAADDETVRVDSLEGITTIVGRDETSGKEHGFAFVDNTFFWASPPARVAPASTLSPEAPASFAPPDARLPTILEDVGRDESPVWALVTGPSLQALADDLAGREEQGLAPLAELLARSETLALGLGLEGANEASLRLAGLVERGVPLDDATRALLAAPIESENEAFRVALACEERGRERWSCEGRIEGFRDALFSLMDAAQSEMEKQR